ncbi:SIR2 family protein [Bacillus pumilus]|uniref:SIR2 family protein n=1 Tax=Bacillus TaxID=1386 RepID=UPI0025A192F9|nr:SIR2 family protein [Bacillus pumilus]MDM5319017.1 SIR2 family protein [Bacillus pumilus]MDR4994342.1 SIR2 family protein [Bacillus altitudinis]
MGVAYAKYLEESLSRMKNIINDSGTRPILFVGSGISRRYIDTPDWESLLEKLIDLNPNINMPIGYFVQQTENDYPAIANLLLEEYQKYAWENKNKDVFPEELYDGKFDKDIFLKYKISEYIKELSETFNINQHKYQSELEAFRKLNPHAIITTNYDDLLERLFPKFNVVVGQQVIKQKNSTSLGHILKIHGSINEISGIVISQDDYANFERKQKYLSAKLLTYFMEHPLFFLGYSVTDENIRAILADISEIVTENTDVVVENIWFIDWNLEIDENLSPPTDRYITLGDGKTIRINYVLVSDFLRVYQELYQASIVEISELRALEENIYNIVKSKTISNLEVDMISISDINSVEKIEEFIGIDEQVESGKLNVKNVIGLSTISDPQQLVTRFSLTLSDVGRKLGFDGWYNANQLIKKVEEQEGISIKGTTNNYHINVGTKLPVHRYSKQMVDLLKLVKEGKEYSLDL